MSLKTDYKDALYDGQRRYRLIQNEDGTYSLPDETTYTQAGDKFGANELNAICEEVNQKVDDTGDASQTTATFTQATNRANLTTGEKLSTLFGKIMKWFADLKAVAFSGAASDLTQDATHRFVTDAEKTGWNAKAGTAVATTTANGLMAAADKTKLNGIASGANAYTHPATHPASMITGLPTSLPANGGNADTVDGLHAASFLQTSASCNKNWNWSGQGGQPQWLWGGNDASNMYVYNPSNFSVTYAASAGSANAVAWTNVSGRPSSLPANGGTSAACSGNAATATNATNHINASGWHVAIQEAAPATGRLWAW